MSKYFKRAFGGYKPVDKLIVVELEELDAKKVPNCSALCVEVKRGDRNIRSKEIPCHKGISFPIHINSQLAMLSQFYVDKDKVQDKTLNLRMLALSAGDPDVVLGETNFNISRFYGHKQQKMELPIRDEFFTIHCKISVVDLSHGPDVDVDVAHVLKMEDPNRLKNISQEQRTHISSQSSIHEERRAKGEVTMELGTHYET